MEKTIAQRLPGAVLATTALLLVPAQPAAAAVPGLVRVSSTSDAGSPTTSTTSVYCPYGTSVTGVGGEVFGGKGQVGLTEYTHAERQWGVARGHEDDDGTGNTWTVTAYAICAEGDHREWVFGSTAEDSATDKGTTVSCPAGTLLTGGGASLTGAGDTLRNLVLDDVIPSADLTRLTVAGFEDQDGTSASWRVAASARCGVPLPGQQRVRAVSASDSVSPKSVTATCPAGQRVIGTGSEILNGRGQVLLDDVVPNSDLTSVRVEAFEDQDGTANHWSVTGYAICADQ